MRAGISTANSSGSHVNRAIRQDYDAVVNANIGAALKLGRKITLRGGYAVQPDPRPTEELDRSKQFFSAGIGYLFQWVFEIDLGWTTEFQRRVIRRCRRIPYGKTATYGQIASAAGSPGAARAVGSCMAANRFPLIVPCHRVVRSGGGIGAFSAPGGTRTKRRLLAMESAS